MRKILAMLIVSSMIMAGCMGLTEEDAEKIADELINVPGCDDDTAYNYDENATNSEACLTEMVLRDSVAAFVLLVDQGPEWGETMGMITQGSDTDEDGETTSFTSTLAVSPEAGYVSMEMDMGMMVIEISELITANSDGTTNIQANWMGTEFQMNSAGLFADHWNNESFLDDDDDEGHGDDGDHGDDDDGSSIVHPTFICGNGDEIPFEYVNDGEADCTDGADEQQYNTEGEEINWFDCSGGTTVWISDVNDGFEDCPYGDDEMPGDHHDDGDMDGEMDLGLPDTDVEIPEDFDPATALFEAGLATSSGYSFSTTSTDEDGYTYTMTFIISPALEVTSFVLVESYPDGMSSTASITILDADDASALLVSDDTLMAHALPFTLEPMDAPHGDHGDHDDHDHGDHDGHDEGGHDDHDDHDDDELPSESDMFDMFDENADGMLTLAEIMSGFETMGEDTPPTPEQALEDGDADESDGISWDEFVELWNSFEDEDDPEDNHLNNSPALEADFHDAFNNSDDDDSGELTVDELQDFIDLVSELSSDDHDHDRNFVCSSTVSGEPDMEIAFELVNDGTEDCGDGADEPQDADPAVDSDEDGIADNDVDNWFDCYNGDDIAMNLVNDGNEDCSMGEDEHDSEPWMMFDDCTDMSSSSPDGGSMWECFVDMDGDGTLTSEESMGMWYICEMITMVDGDMWFCEPEPQHNEDGLSEEAVSMFFDAADADGDGMLTATEFSLLYSVFASGDDGPSPEIFHAILDSDGDGEVTASEYSEFLNASGVSGIEFSDVEAMIEMYDEDSSGGLNVDELEVMLEETGDDDDHYVFYCSNDGEEYANSMGGILCPEGAGVVPTCPDGELCVCIDVDGSCTDGDDDWGYEDHGDGGHDDGGHDGHDDGGHDGHDDGDHGDHDDHDMHAVFDWTVVSTDMMTVDEIDGDFADYHIVLSLCMMDEEGSDDMMDMSSPTMTCGDDVMKVSMAEASAPGADIMFHDADSSGTITDGDMVHVSPDIDAGGDWNTVRLYSASADKYSDENPMLPGFGAAAGLIALLGAALLTRRD